MFCVRRILEFWLSWVVDGWEIVSITDSTSMTESAVPKTIVPEFITSKITDTKLNGDNHLQ